MKKFFAHRATKIFFSLIAGFYTVAVVYLCYFSIFYNIHIDQRGSVCLLVTAASVVALLLMLYTRKQFITRLSSFLILPVMLPVVLLYFGEWEIIIPVVITGVIILLLSGAGEGAKTAIGTLILLLYIFGALGYFLFTSFFVSAAKQNVVQSGESPTGIYRYRVVNTEDSSNGSTAVYVEPNYADVVYPYVKFTLKNQERIVLTERPICEEINIEWENKTRQEITEELLAISDTITVHLSESELEEFGYPFDTRLQLADVDINERFALGLTAKDVDPISLDTLTAEQLATFNIGKDAANRYYVLNPSEELLLDTDAVQGELLYFKDLDSKAMKQFNSDARTDEYGNPLYTLEVKDSVLLADLSDSQLAQLGVSESGDVMIFNGKICFRYYVAELDDYFDTESRKLSIDLLN
ncbi:MAG: hypothetical protein J6L99_05280 [Ruminococcus sp.]|nr:hypothetical protein [Ruminococcus sp.]